MGKQYENNLDDKPKFEYPHQQRFISLVDQRTFGDDSVYIYQPPSNCRYIPNDAVSEWYSNSTITCLLPNMEYGDGKEAESNQEATMIELENANIHGKSHCNGSLLTLSFHVKQRNEIKCCLYWNGQMTRFMPEDIGSILPRMFNLEWNNGEEIGRDELSKNQEFMKDQDEIGRLIQEMKKVLKDDYFERFQKDICEHVDN